LIEDHRRQKARDGTVISGHQLRLRASCCTLARLSRTGADGQRHIHNGEATRGGKVPNQATGKLTAGTKISRSMTDDAANWRPPVRPPNVEPANDDHSQADDPHQSLLTRQSPAHQ
jgi:hypothetical protein